MIHQPMPPPIAIFSGFAIEVAEAKWNVLVASRPESQGDAHLH